MMLAASEWVSATVAYEVTGEIQRKRRLARWRAWAERDGGA